MASDLKFWRAEVERGERIGESYHSAWAENLKKYAGDNSGSPDGYVNVNVDFYQVEQKGAQLFFETPELQMSPGVGFDPTVPGVLAFRAILNALLGPDRIDALTTVQKSIKNCTASAGFGPTVIGYQPTIVETPNIPQPGAILGLSAPNTDTVPVPIHEEWFWTDLSVKKFIIPAEWHDSANYDKAPWLAYPFKVPLRSAQQFCQLPADFEGTMTGDDKILNDQAQETSTGIAYVEGTIVWYRAALFDDDAMHPELFRRHVIVDGLEDFADKPGPAWQSPYQTIGLDGRLTADSLIGNPIHPLTLRDLPDSAYVPSDLAMTRPLVDELCLFRTQMVEERDINKPKFAYDATKFPPDAIDRLTKAMTGSLIGLPTECFVGDKVVGFSLLTQGSSPRQTYLANDYIERDIQKTLRIGANASGVTEDGGKKTATEIDEIKQSLQVAMDAERKRVVRWYLKAVDKIAALVLRFMTDPKRIAELIGIPATMAYLQWRESILKEGGDPRPKFTVKLNSQLHFDAGREFADAMKVYEFFAKDPLFNRGEWMRKILLLKGEDPIKFVADQPPEQKPEPSLGYSFKGEDLNPLMPQFPLVVEVLAQCGVQISPEAMQEAQAGANNSMLAQMAITQMTPTSASGKPATKTPAPHGGLAEKASPLSKHAADQTGERSGPKTN